VVFGGLGGVWGVWLGVGLVGLVWVVVVWGFCGLGGWLVVVLGVVGLVLCVDCGGVWWFCGLGGACWGVVVEWRVGGGLLVGCWGWGIGGG